MATNTPTDSQSASGARGLGQAVWRYIVSLQLMTDISLEVIVRTIFGGDDRELATQLMDASRRVVASSSPLLFFSRQTHVPFFGLSPWDRWKRAKKELFQLLDEVIEKRQQCNSPREDILSMLLCGNLRRWQIDHTRAYLFRIDDLFVCRA